MAQTKVWPVDIGTTIRRNRTTGATAGQGQSKRWYVGRHGSFDYDAFVKFTQDWTNVGRIVSAVLTVYTGDGLGDTPSTTTDTPHFIVRRNTSAFVEGNAPDGTWEANDFTSPSQTSTHQRSPDISRAELTVNNIDVTDIIEDMAPGTVKKRSGAAGGKAANYGFAFLGSDDPLKNIDLVSDKWTDPALRPVITLTYEFGLTAPDTPSNVLPSGVVTSFTEFQGDFTDRRPTDILRSSEVQVFDAGHACTATAVDNVVTSANHGLIDGDTVYLTAITGGENLVIYTAYTVQRLSANTFWLIAPWTGLVVNITTNLTAGTWSKRLYAGTKKATTTEVESDRFFHLPDNIHLRPNTTYRWRARVTDQEGMQSAFTSLISFSFSNTAPNAPDVSPDVATYATFDGIKFNGDFSDPDAGDFLLAYEVQMSAYPEGDAHWDDVEFILWNTGKQYLQMPNGGTVLPGPGVVVPTRWSTPYGGGNLLAGTYYWRARVYDNKHSASGWTYAQVTLTEDFEAEPADSNVAIQLRPKVPWRLVIKGMGANRGPGTVVAILEDAKNIGASILYNSPGEAHWTLPKDHPQISAIEPKQTHYSIQFRQGDGWREVYAGLVWDFDATDTDVVFYGIDYVALLDYVLDERYDASNPDKPAESGGSKYVTTGKNSISYIVNDQLTLAKNLSNSPVGFITVGTIASMPETLVVYSTYAPVLTFLVGLLDSHRAGTGKKTRLSCRQKAGGGYEWVVQDDPGQTRDNLRMRYGELVQGYRVIAFGSEWGSRVSAIGRSREGIKVLYKTANAPGIDEAVWGRFTQVRLIDGIADENDLMRRTKQDALHSGKLGNSIALGIRSGVLNPRDGYDVCDAFPIDIEDGSVSTDAFGSGYWTVLGVTWTCDAKDGKQITSLTFTPREDTTPPDTDLLVLKPISPQREWQVGWAPPTSRINLHISHDTGLYMDEDVVWLMDAFINPRLLYHTDISTGLVYASNDNGVTWELVSGQPTIQRPETLVVDSRKTLTDAGVTVVNINVRVTNA